MNKRDDLDPLQQLRASAKPPLHISVKGNHYECGRACGEKSAERINRSLESYREMFATCDIPWQRAVDIALPCMDIAFKKFPKLSEEIKGIADGSGTDTDSLAALNCRTEILPPDYLARATGKTAAELPDGGHISECTSFAFHRETDSTWLAQNWDWIGQQRESLVLLESRRNDGAAYLCVTEAGMLAKIGLNEHGLGITLNILRSARDGISPGMPVHLFLRGLLDCESVEEAVSLAQSVTFASSSNIMVADQLGQMASIEASPVGARILSPENQQLYHTNHFLHDELAGIDAGLLGNISTQARLEKATELLDDKVVSDQESLARIRQVLSDTSDGLQSICRFPDTTMPVCAQVETVVAVAMDLPERRLWLSAAQPSVTPLKAFQLH